MYRRFYLVLGVLVAVTAVIWSALAAPPTPAVPAVAPEPAAKVADLPPPPKVAPSRVVGVTVYPQNALVTREVTVPEGMGTLELVVNPLPPQTVNSTLYSEGTDGIRVLTTRYRTRPIREDTREEVRKLEAQLKELQLSGQKLQSDMKVMEQNLQMLGKLEGFTGASLQHQTEKGTLNADSVIALSKHIMDGRAEKNQALVTAQQQQQENLEKVQFIQRKLHELSAGTSKTERDAVIVVDKKEAGPGKVRLNYLVDSANWHPQYKFRAGTKDKDPVQVEYLAAITQQTGEDWGHVSLTLSTAQPMLNAAPPELKMLEVAVVPRNGAPGQAGAIPGQVPGMGGKPNAAYGLELQKQAQGKRSQAVQEFNAKKDGAANTMLLNEAAALEQTWDMLAQREEEVHRNKLPAHPSSGEGPSITYHLKTHLTIPSRNDEQIIEVAKLDMAPDYYYKAVPVLTQHVYRLATLTNKSEYVLLPGEATMYLGTDFVGLTNLPLVAIGEQFTAGFGVDPQLQVQRQLIDKSRTTQGDNQVLKYGYRILVSSYKSEPVKLQVWDRLPHAETEAVGVNLIKTAPEVSADPLYLRECKPHNLLRWDLTAEPAMNGEKAMAVNYEFKMELGRQMMIGNFLTK